MADTNAGHPVLNVILFVVAAITGFKGMNITEEELDYYNKLFALILKGVSIISFLLIILINFGKIVSMVKGWFKTDKNE